MSGFNTTIIIACLLGAAALLLALPQAKSRKSDVKRLYGLLTPASAAPAALAATGLHTTERLPASLKRRLYQAGWELSSRHLLYIALGFAALIVGAGVIGGPIAVPLAALTLGAFAWAAVEYRARARMRLLSDCMVGFLERIRQLLAVGNSFSTALQRAAENSPPVVAHYLAPTVRRINNGDGVSESIERCAAELDVYELHLLSTAARTHLRFGGSMTNILKNIIENIRRRSAVERELRANTAQVRLSAWVLGLLPLLVASLVMLSNRGYSEWFLATPTGNHMLIYAGLSQFAGVFCMRLIIRTRY